MMYFWFILLVAFIVALVYLLKNAKLGGLSLRQKEAPLDVLKRRFARGEISKEEYEERKAILLEEEQQESDLL